MKLFLILILTSISTTSLLANEGSYDASKPITAEERSTSETYMHDGILQKKNAELCANNKYSDICTNNETAFRSESWQKMEKIMPAVGKAYSLVVMMTMKGGSGKTDYCALIPIAGEAAAVVIAKSDNDKIAQNLDKSNSMSKQAQSFLATATKHKDLRDQTTTQAAVWAAGAVCYTAKIIASYYGAGEVSATDYAKLAGSVMMGTFYGYKATYHNERYKQLKGMASKLPGRGDCNPVTETTCFCSEDSSKTVDSENYQKYCVPEELANRPGNPTSCVTATGLADPNCNCKLTNSCITTKIGKLGLKLGFNGSHLQKVIDGIKPLGTGFYGADFQATTAKNMAFAKKQLKKAPKAKVDPNLSKDQKKMAALIASMGVPKSIAASLAKQPSAKLPSSIADSNPKITPRKSISYTKDPVFKKGKNIRKKRNKRGSSPFARRKTKSSNSSGIEIDGYIEKAQREAEIVKDTSKPIFDIISYRYKKSAWREFKSNLEEKKEIQK